MKLRSGHLASVGALAASACVAAPAPVTAPVVVELPPVSSAPTAPTAPARQEPPAPSVVGRWEGTGKQSDGASWPMEVEILSPHAGRCATVRYPSIPCASEWVCSEGSDGTILRAREQVTEGRNVCLDGDVTAAVTPAGELEFRWTGKEPQREVSAEAVLRRAK